MMMKRRGIFGLLAASLLGAAGAFRARIIRVTHLGDSGEGSFRAALEAEGPRTVVFDVSGNIDLLAPITITHPYLHVDGTTAQSHITVRNKGIIINTKPVSVTQAVMFSNIGHNGVMG